jgi:LEA14-like dessication related protein
MKNYILFFIAAFALSSCGDFHDLSFKGIEQVKIIKMSQQGIEAEITARIDNPNTMTFHIYPSALDASLNGINTGKTYLTNNVKIKANKEDSYIFKIKSDFSSLGMTDLPRLLSAVSSRTVKVNLKGNLKVGKLLIKKKYPVDMTQNVPLNAAGLN